LGKWDLLAAWIRAYTSISMKVHGFCKGMISHCNKIHLFLTIFLGIVCVGYELI